MKLTFENSEAEDYFYNALCNGLGYIESYGIGLKINPISYQKAKCRLKKKSPKVAICYEDILMQILRQGDTLTMVDYEEEETVLASIDINDVHNRMGIVPIRRMSQMVEEEDDAETADVIIQTIFFKEVIYG